MNSIRNKFDILGEQIKGSIDIFMVSERRLHDSFPEGQFLKVFIHHLDLTVIKMVEELCFTYGKISQQLLTHDFLSAEKFSIEINLYKKKWLLTVLITPTTVTLENILISSAYHQTGFLRNTRILYFLMILMHMLMMRLYKHFANFIPCIVSFI